jgi:hypothetical protein
MVCQDGNQFCYSRIYWQGSLEVTATNLRGLRILNALPKREKQNNSVLVRKRIVIEHISRSLKVFRILSQRHHNRRKRFALRFNLIAAIYNLELKPK